MTAKKFRCHQVIPSRGSEDLDLMRRVLRLKLNQHPLLIPQLMAIPAEAVIIEDASRRGGASAAFWGMKIQNGIWSGQNWLGRLWMELRVELENQMEHELTNVSGKIAKGRVHMFVSYRPQQDISSIVQWLKGTSSRILIQEFAHLRNAVLGKASLGQGIPCDQFG